MTLILLFLFCKNIVKRLDLFKLSSQITDQFSYSNNAHHSQRFPLDAFSVRGCKHVRKMIHHD